MSDGTDMRRRDFILGSAVVGSALSTLGMNAPPAQAAAQKSSDIVEWEATELASAIHARKVSCEEVMHAYLDRIKRANGKVNAVVSLQDPEGLIKEARSKDTDLARGATPGPLYGFPHAVKDLQPVKGIRFTRGSPIYKDNVADTDSLYVQRLRAAGAIMIGKTNTPEFGLGSHTINRVFGATSNPYNSKYSSGGSSGGAAVGLSLRMLPVADGSDYGGSLRNPAGWNNVCGFRVSIGRVPGVGGEMWLPSMSVSGPMGKTVGDVALLLSVMAGPDPRVPLALEGDAAQFRGVLKADMKGTRIGWLGDFKGTVPYEAGVADVCKDALKRFTSLGCTVEETAPDYDVERAWQAFMTIRGWQMGGQFTSMTPEQQALLNQQALFELDKSQHLSLHDVMQASAVRSQWTAAVNKLFERYDFLIAPTAQLFPFELTQPWPTEIAGQKMRTYHEWMKGVCLITLTGCPSLAVPAGFGAKGLPMGIQIIAPVRQEMAALKMGTAYEAVEPLWRLKAPKVA